MAQQRWEMGAEAAPQRFFLAFCSALTTVVANPGKHRLPACLEEAFLETQRLCERVSEVFLFFSEQDAAQGRAQSSQPGAKTT